MTLHLPGDLPPWLFEFAVGHFPVGDETKLRRVGAAWGRVADVLGTAGVRRGLTGGSAGMAGVAAAAFEQRQGRDRASVRDLAAHCRSMQEQCNDGAMSIEFNKLQVILTAYLLLGQLLLDAMMFHYGVVKAVEDRAVARAAMAQARARAVRAIVDDGARHQARRAALKATGISAIAGAGFGAATNAAAQAIQIGRYGTRTDFDAWSLWEAAASGAVGGAAGAAVTVPMARRLRPSALRGTGRGAHVMRYLTNTGSTLVIGAASGVAGGVAGLLPSAAFAVAGGYSLSPYDLRQAVVTGFGGGLVGSAVTGLTAKTGPAPHAATGAAPSPESGPLSPHAAVTAPKADPGPPALPGIGPVLSHDDGMQALGPTIDKGPWPADAGWPVDRAVTEAERSDARRAWLELSETIDLPVFYDADAYYDPIDVGAVADRAVGVAQWWDSLDRRTADGFVYDSYLTDQIRNLEGIPTDVRDTANRLALLRLLDAAGPDTPLAAIRDLVAAADTAEDGISASGHSRLLTLELTDTQSAPRSLEIVFGDPSANMAATHVLRSGLGVAEVKAAMVDVVAHYAEAARRSSDGATVTLRMRGEYLPSSETVAMLHARSFGVFVNRDSNRLLGDLAGRNRLWARSHSGVGRQVHLVADGAGDVVGYAGRLGRLAEAGVLRTTYLRCEVAGPVDHAAELQCHVFAHDPGPGDLRWMNVGMNPADSYFGARAVAGAADGVGAALAGITLGRHDPGPIGDGAAPAALGDALADANAPAAAVADAFHAARREALSDPQILGALAADPAALHRLASTNGVPWHVRDLIHRRSGGELGSAMRPIERSALEAMGSPPVRVLRHAADGGDVLVAVGHQDAAIAIVLVGDEGLDRVGAAAVRLYAAATAARAFGGGHGTAAVLALAVRELRPGRTHPAETAARIAAAVAEGLERPGGRPRTVHLVGERAGAAAIDAAGAGSDWVDKVGSVTFIDPPAGLTGGYEVADVFVAWRPSENPVSLPDIGARRVELTEANLGSIFTRRGDEIADRESARITGPRQVRAAVDRLTAFVADRMKARGWMTPGHFRDLEFVMGELAGSAAPGGEVSVEVTVRGAPGQQTLTVRVVNQGLGVVPQGLVGMLATVVTADAHHAGGTVTFQLAEARPSTAIVSEAAAVRARRDATRLALHWSEFRRWESARALFDERTGMYLADNGIVGSARARAFHDLTWNQRAALALFDSGSSPATPGMTPAWRDRVERMYIKRKLEALRTWPADLDVHQSADLATYELVERVLEYLDDTAAVLGTTAHLLRLDLDRGIVIALGDVGIAQRVTTHATEPMLRETLPVVMDLVAHRHRLSAAEGAASVLAMAWPMPESPAAFVAEFLTDLMAQRDYYAQLPDGIPHAAEYRKKTVEFADVFDFAWVRRNLESGPEAAAGSPAPAPHQARRQRLLDRVPHDEGMVGLHILRHLVDRPPADGTPPRGSRVDTNGLIGRPGPISPAEWAVRAHADFHPEAFVSPAALGARLADRPGALVAAFFDDPGGTRLLFVRNVDGALEALDVGSLRRTDPRIDGLAAATVQASWRALEPDRRLSGAKAWYGIPFDAEGLPQRALTAGRSTGRAGETMPVQWIGGPPELAGVDSPVPEGETDLHFMYDHPNDCAQVALDCLRAKLPTAGIRDFVSESGARYRGLSPHSFAALTQAGWRPGGYPSVDAVVAEVRDTGAVVAMVIEYEGLATFNAGVGSHVIVVYRHHNETVRLYEKIDGQVLDRPFEEFPANRRVGTVYGIGWNSDGTPLHPLRTGSAPGRDLPSSQLGSSHTRTAQ